MYKFESKIRYSELDEKGYLAVPKIVDYFQDCSNMQSDTLGVGREYLEEKQIQKACMGTKFMADCD